MDPAKPPGHPAGLAAREPTADEVCVLLALAAETEREWTVAEAAERAAGSLAGVGEALAGLARRGVLEPCGDGRYRLAPGCDLRDVVGTAFDRGGHELAAAPRVPNRRAVERARAYVRAYEYLQLLERRRRR